MNRNDSYFLQDKATIIAQHSRATAARSHQVPVSVIRAGMGICRRHDADLSDPVGKFVDRQRE